MLGFSFALIANEILLLYDIIFKIKKKKRFVHVCHQFSSSVPYEATQY